MFLFVLNRIEDIVKRYTEAYVFTNSQDLSVELRCHINEEDKEWLLSDIDNELRDFAPFSHEYNEINGFLIVTFK